MQKWRTIGLCSTSRIEGEHLVKVRNPRYSQMVVSRVSQVSARHKSARSGRKLRLQNLWDGIEVLAGLIGGVGPEWK